MREIMNMFLVAFVFFAGFFSVSFASAVNSPLQKKTVRHVLGVCSNEKVRFYLNRQGRVFIEGVEGLNALRLPNRIIQIKFYNDALYFLREEGTVWYLTKGRLRMLPLTLPVRQMEFVNDGIYLLTMAGGLLQFDKNGEKDLLGLKSLEMMVSYGDDKLYMLDSWGRFFSYNVGTAQFLQKGSVPDTVQIVSTEHSVFLLKANGDIWRYDDREFHPLQVEFQSKMLAAGADDVFICDQNSEVWKLTESVNQLDKLPFFRGVSEIYWDRGSLFVTNKDGAVFEYKRPVIHKDTQRELRKRWNNDFFPLNKGFADTSYIEK
jgi:alpha-tubulin suppressor-like RCC1 family protein